MRYADARPHLRTGDVLLWRGRRLFSWLIRWKGGTVWSHAGYVVVLHGRVLVSESVEGKGCRLVPLSDALSTGDHIDLFKPRASVRRALDDERLVLEALAHLSQPYNTFGILRVAVRFLLPWRAERSLDDTAAAGRRRFCSEHVSAAFQAAGVDLVPMRSHAATEPGHIATSAELVYQGRLEP